jgi:GDP-mannose 6-dehydrogenase
MKISVFGLGYVGCVSAACLAQDGHTVVGVDVDPRKVQAINEGRAPFFEPGLEEILSEARKRGNLTAIANEREAIDLTDLALICVGTPSERTGGTRLDALRGVLTAIGAALRKRTLPFVVILRSTVLPHVVEGELIPLLERAAGRHLGDQLQFCYNPEFLREGTAIRDFYEAPMVVVGHNGGWAAETVARLYSNVQAPIIYTEIGTACMVKYVCNAFHALKVSFANEIGQLSESLKVNGQRVMEIVCMDKKLNISPMYLKPGFAFGGSCLPKDLRAITSESRQRGLALPLIQSILPSNKSHLESCIDYVLDTGEKSVGLFGLTFKEGTDDLRESPAVGMAETLLGKGLHLTIYEPAISQNTIHGANLAFIEKNIPHIWSLLTPRLSDILASKVVVLLKNLSDVERKALRALTADQTCIDFANALGNEELRARTAIFGIGSREDKEQLCFQPGSTNVEMRDGEASRSPVQGLTQ